MPQMLAVHRSPLIVKDMLRREVLGATWLILALALVVAILTPGGIGQHSCDELCGTNVTAT